MAKPRDIPTRAVVRKISKHRAGALARDACMWTRIGRASQEDINAMRELMRDLQNTRIELDIMEGFVCHLYDHALSEHFDHLQNIEHKRRALFRRITTNT